MHILFSRTAPLAATLLIGSATLVACSDGTGVDTTGTGTGGTGGNSTTSAGGSGSGGAAPGLPYQPAGCGFEIAPRPEYLEWSVDKPDTLPSPNIRWVRLGLGGNVAVGAPGKADPSTSIGMSWQTDQGTFASEVRWGSSPDPASWPDENSAHGVSWLTPQGLLNPNGDAQMHEVHVCGLTPGTTYYYRVGGGPKDGGAWSEVYSFTTAPASGDTPVTIAFNGDARGQTGNAWRLFQRKVLSTGVNLQLFSGDTIALALDQGEWEQWLDLGWRDQDGSLLTSGQVLTLMTNGNHDNRSSLFFGNVALPQDGKNYPAYAELIYSVDVGPVHVTVIDDSFFTSSSTPDEDHAAIAGWLEADLKAANDNRAKVPWLVTMHHHGPFSSSSHGKDADVLRGRAVLMPLFDQYHVDVDVAGHDHNYERSKPLTGPAKTPTIHDAAKDGTVYVICAGAGAPAYSPGTSSFTALSKGYKSGGAIGTYGLLKASMTELVLDAYELRPDGTDPLFDSYTITK